MIKFKKTMRGWDDILSSKYLVMKNLWARLNVFRHARRTFETLTKGIPLFDKLMIELQSNCNRDCFFCPRHGDTSGQRKREDGSHVAAAMSTDEALKIMDQARDMGFRGLVSFHHLSESFLDRRIIDMAREARRRGMKPYEHTNGDVLRHNDALAREAAQVFEYLVVGLYDYKDRGELLRERKFWRERLQGTRVSFSEHEDVYPRSFISFDSRMTRQKTCYPHKVCRRPLIRLMVHYDGEVALCCEDMLAQFGLGNAFRTPLKDIWYSPKHIEIINHLKHGLRNRYPLCSRCPLPPF